jgi:hypothetical protein
MSRRNRQLGDAIEPTTAEAETGDVTEAVAEFSKTETTRPGRYVPKPGELHCVDYMGRKKPAGKKR